jgi:TetR/AcrR family transcriptional regulator
MDYATFSITAPMVFLIMMKHSMGACVAKDFVMDPERYINSQAETLLKGFLARPEDGKNKPEGRARK